MAVFNSYAALPDGIFCGSKARKGVPPSWWFLMVRWSDTFDGKECPHDPSHKAPRAHRATIQSQPWMNESPWLHPRSRKKNKGRPAQRRIHNTGILWEPWVTNKFVTPLEETKKTKGGGGTWNSSGCGQSKAVNFSVLHSVWWESQDVLPGPFHKLSK